jgi:hypothetical protein
MGKLEKYRQVLREIILRYGSYSSRYSKTDLLPICDDERGEYLLMDVGWQENEKRTYLVVFHFRIKDGKIYVEQDNTDADPVQQMIDAGVPKEDIVLAFYPPSHRKLTDFAVA